MFGGNLVGNWLVFWTRDKYLQKKTEFLFENKQRVYFFEN